MRLIGDISFGRSNKRVLLVVDRDKVLLGVVEFVRDGGGERKGFGWIDRVFNFISSISAGR